MRLIAVDTETHLIEPGVGAPKLVCMSVAEDGCASALHDHETTPSLLKAWLQDPGVRLVIHNAAFDMAVFAANWPELLPDIFNAYDDGRIACTKVREQLCAIEQGDLSFRRGKKLDFSLAGLCKYYLNADIDKSEDTWRMRYAELDGVSLDEWPREAVRYAVEDAEWHLKLYKTQTHHSPDEARQCAADFVLRLCSVWGVRTDGEAVSALKDRLTNENNALAEEMIEAEVMRAGKRSKNLAKMRELIGQHFASIGEEPPLTKKGAISYASDVLDRCTSHPVLAKVSRYAANEKNLSAFVKQMELATEIPLTSSPNVLVMSGRTSWRKPNLQQLPREPGIRDCFVPRPGYAFIDADYDSLELRTLAQVLLDVVGRSTLAARYQDDPEYDPHTALASQILGIDYTEGMKRKNAKDKELKDMRQMAKAANFGYPGGMGPEKFILYAGKSYGVDLTLDKSRWLKDQWIKSQPEIKDYFQVISNLTRSGLSITQLRSGRVRGGVGFCDGCNTYFQGLAADGAKASLFQVSRAAYTDRDSPLFGTRPVIFAHDEILAEAPESKARAAAEELARVMCETMQKFVPDVPIRASPILMRRWYKEADTVRDGNGELQFWEPK